MTSEDALLVVIRTALETAHDRQQPELVRLVTIQVDLERALRLHKVEDLAWYLGLRERALVAP